MFDTVRLFNFSKPEYWKIISRFTFSWLLVVLNIISYVYWPFTFLFSVHILCRFFLFSCLLLGFRNTLYILDTNPLLYILQTFCSSLLYLFIFVSACLLHSTIMYSGPSSISGQSVFLLVLCSMYSPRWCSEITL